MPRILRIIKPNTFYHIFTRGSRKGILFFEEKDYQFFLNEFMKYCNKFSINISVYCLLPNHIHFILFIIEPNLSKFLQCILTKYAIYFNKKYKNSGHVFQGRFGYKEINNENYFKLCADYIHLNPVKANIIVQPEKYQWSSCKYYFKTAEVPEDYPIDIRFLLNYYQNNDNLVFENYKKHLYNIKDQEIEIEKIKRFEKDIENLYNRRNIRTEINHLKQRKEDILYDKIYKKEEVIKCILEYFNLSDLKNNLNKKFFNIHLSRIIIYVLLTLTSLKYSELFEIVEKSNKKTIYSAKKDIENKMKKNFRFKGEITKLLNFIQLKIR